MDDTSRPNGNRELTALHRDGRPNGGGHSNGSSSGGPSVAEVVAAQISDAIMLGEYPLGTWLRQEQLAQRFQVSRQPIREALRLLEAVGMIQARPRRGVRVSGPAPQYINDGYMIRSELEGLATRLAAERRSEAQLRQMREVLDSFKAGVREAMARDSDADIHTAWIRNHDHFHALIHEASGIERLAQLIGTINMSLPHNLSISALQARGALEENLLQHELILAAIELGLPDVAEAAMEEHVRRSGELTVDWFTSQQEALGDDEDLDDDWSTGPRMLRGPSASS